jgi:hypothetical protein
VTSLHLYAHVCFTVRHAAAVQSSLSSVWFKATGASPRAWARLKTLVYREASRIAKSHITGLTGTAKVDRFFFVFSSPKSFQPMRSDVWHMYEVLNVKKNN